MNICNEHTLCSHLSEFIETDESKPGFHLWKKVENGKLVTKGVLYKTKKKKRAMILNRCPWCEAELNDMKTADEMTDEEFTAAVEEWTSPAAKEIEALRAENSEYRELLRELLVQLRENTGIPEDGNAPFHAHEVPGVWDDDNDELSGKPCAWCAVWARAVANGLVGSNAEFSGADRRPLE